MAEPRHHAGRTGAGKSERKVSPGAARGTRTAVQGGAGILLAELVDSLVDLPDPTVVILAAILGGFVSWAQVVIEDAVGHAFLREIPEPDQPVADAP